MFDSEKDKKKKKKRKKERKKEKSEKGSREESNRKTKTWKTFDLIPLKKNEFRSVKRDRDKNRKSFKNKFNWSRGIGEESSKPESFSLKIGIFIFFSIGWKTGSIDQILKKQKFFEKSGKFSTETFVN